MATNQSVWYPHLTVSAIVEHEQRFLMVEETINGRMGINQPSGHLDEDETLLEAVCRETLEESQFGFTPQNLVGIYQYKTPSGITFVRVCFCGELGEFHAHRSLDKGIERVVWLTHEEIANSPQLRSPMVLQCVKDYLAGQRYPLSLCQNLATEEF